METVGAKVVAVNTAIDKCKCNICFIFLLWRSNVGANALHGCKKKQSLCGCTQISSLRWEEA